jgi:hypothetical protein
MADVPKSLEANPPTFTFATGSNTRKDGDRVVEWKVPPPLRLFSDTASSNAKRRGSLDPPPSVPEYRLPVFMNVSVFTTGLLGALQTASTAFSKFQVLAAQRALIASSPKSSKSTPNGSTRSAVKRQSIKIPTAEDPIPLVASQTGKKTPGDEPAQSQDEVARLRSELTTLRANIASEAHAIVQKELQTRQVAPLFPSTCDLPPVLMLTACFQLETVEGVVLLQGKYDAICRKLDRARAELSAAKLEAQTSAGSLSALQRQLDDRVQEVVCARGEIESLTNLAQALHDALTASNSGGEGKLDMVCSWGLFRKG